MKDFKTPIAIIILLSVLSFIACSDKNNVNNSKYDANNPPEYNDQKAFSATGSNAMVVGTSGEPAVEAALEILKEGGNACDAVLAGAMDQVALAAGCWVSYAGVMSMVYYKADTGEVFTICGTFKSPYEETDPMSIPGDAPSGRTALVPGFLGAVDEAHKKLGSVSFERVLAPAIKTAEDGFELTEYLEKLISYKWDVITRTPEGKAIFSSPNSSYYTEGSIFKQPHLAETLRKFAAQRSDYIYRGEWARSFVQIVQREGGKITMRDMEDYKPVWTKPAHTNYYGYDVFSINYPCTGGVSIIAGLNMMQAAGLNTIGGYTTVPKSFYNLVKIARIASMTANTNRFLDFMKQHYPDMDFSYDFMLEPAAAGFFWNLIATGIWSDLEKEFFGVSGNQAVSSSHTAAIMAIDKMGNAASLTHTINTSIWGNTGIFVDGISIPDSGAGRKSEMARKGTGQYLLEGTASIVIVKDGKAFLAGGSPNQSIIECTLQHIHNIINDGLEPARSIARRAFNSFDWNNPICQNVPSAEFPVSFVTKVRKLGQCLTLAGESQQRWGGILFDPLRGLFGGVSTEGRVDAGIAAY